MLSRCLALVGALIATLAVPLTALAALSASTADLTFAPLAYSHDPQVSSGTLTLTASDTGDGDLRLTNDGWNVTLLASDFV